TPEQKAYEKGLAERTKKLDDTLKARLDEVYAVARTQTPRYLAAVLNVEKLPDELFYTNQTKDEIKPAFIRQWHSSLLRAGKTFDPIFAPWHALAALPVPQSSAQFSVTIERLLHDPSRHVNAVVAEAFAKAPPGSLRSMKDVADLYGRLFLDVN